MVGVVLACGCGRPAVRHASARGAAADGVEHRTEEFVTGSQADLRERQTAWAREGWIVTIISAPVTKPDGTVVRRAELTRVRE